MDSQEAIFVDEALKTLRAHPAPMAAAMASVLDLFGAMAATLSAVAEGCHDDDPHTEMFCTPSAALADLVEGEWLTPDGLFSLQMLHAADAWGTGSMFSPVRPDHRRRSVEIDRFQVYSRALSRLRGAPLVDPALLRVSIDDVPHHHVIVETRSRWSGRYSPWHDLMRNGPAQNRWTAAAAFLPAVAASRSALASAIVDVLELMGPRRTAGVRKSLHDWSSQVLSLSRALRSSIAAFAAWPDDRALSETHRCAARLRKIPGTPLSNPHAGLLSTRGCSYSVEYCTVAEYGALAVDSILGTDLDNLMACVDVHGQSTRTELLSRADKWADSVNQWHEVFTRRFGVPGASSLDTWT